MTPLTLGFIDYSLCLICKFMIVSEIACKSKKQQYFALLQCRSANVNYINKFYENCLNPDFLSRLAVKNLRQSTEDFFVIKITSWDLPFPLD